MNITTGSRLGPYEIVSRIGAGGMGEVFKARDTRLDRSVAIKILPDAFAADAQLRQRFEREAKSISQLNHPHICVLHDVGQHDGVTYLVMEFVEGGTLADRLERGPMPVADVIRYGAEIAEALDRAHRGGVVHRDVKPGNIMITKAGVKLLDFGLAKETTHGDLGDTATLYKSLTQEGAVLGTVQYMAPEQLAGENTDARTDIFALGTVLYEMVCGKRPFDGKSRASLIAAIMSAPPTPIRDLKPLSPVSLQHIISKCLEKDPDERWQSAKDIAEELRWIGVSTAEPRSRSTRWLWVVAAIAVLLAAAATVAMLSKKSPPAEAMHLELTPPAGWIFLEQWDEPFAVSPDGKAIVFVAAKSSEEERVLWLRRLSEPAAVPLPGTEGAGSPFWSHDGRSVGFIAGSVVKRVPANGGDAETVCDTKLAFLTGGGAWSANDEIAFTSTKGIHAVSAKGGSPRLIAPASEAVRYHRPDFVGGSEDLVVSKTLSTGDRSIVALSLRGGKEQTVVTNATDPTYLTSGDLAFVNRDVLFVQRFDKDKLQVLGERSAIAKPIGSQLGTSLYSIARDGATLIYQTRSARATDLLFIDRAGRVTPTRVPTANMGDPYISRDGSKALFAIASEGAADVWQLDIATGIPLRLTTGTVSRSAAIWSPDGRQLVFTIDQNLFLMSANGGDPRLLLKNPMQKYASDWSPDGRLIVFSQWDPDSQSDIYAISVSDGKIFPVVHTPFWDLAARFSPDGKWITYVSRESGKDEVYVQKFPSGELKTRVSPNGGLMPVWSPDGRELFYITKDQVVFCTIEQREPLRLSAARPLFDLPPLSTLNPSYAPLPDGQRFLVAKRIDTSQMRVANVVVNWPALRR